MGSRWFRSIHGVKSRTKTRNKIRHILWLFTKSENSKNIIGDSGVLNSNRHDWGYGISQHLPGKYCRILCRQKYTITMDGKGNWGPIPISPSCVWSCQANPGADTHHPSLVHLPALQVVQRRLMQHVKLTHMLHGSGIFTSMFPHHPKVGR